MRKMNMGIIGTVARRMLVAGGALFGLAALPGCIIVDSGGGGGGYANYAPYIADAFVGCAWDSYYQTGVWDFYAYVDDQNGYQDVQYVYVDVIDIYYDPYAVAETWQLAYDYNGEWSQTIYEYNGSGYYDDYSKVLDCNYKYDFEFDFYAVDYYSDSDSVTFIP